MHRIVCSLLIPLVLVSQSFCATHSHVGTSVVEPEGHSERPHIHLRSGTHHDHDRQGQHEEGESHEKYSAVISDHVPVDHDSDAFYVSETQLLSNTMAAKVAKPELSLICVVYDESAAIAGWRLSIGGGLPPPLRDLTCPLYLRILSIRC